MHTEYITLHTTINNCIFPLGFSWLHGSIWLLKGFVAQTSMIFLSMVEKKPLILFED